MAMYINRAPGIMATPHSQAEAGALVAEARALSDGSPPIPAAIAVATAWDPPPGPGEARRVVDVAERAGDGIVHSIALDLLTQTNLVNDDVAEAVRTACRRLELLDTLPVNPLTGFEFADGHLVAAETALGAGDLASAAAHAEALARLPFYRDETLAGHRLVTAVGPDGVGKTRLAISVAADLAEERRDGAWFVDLVRVADPAVVVAAVAEAVGVPERLMASPEAALVAALARRDGLLVLDNCEHLLEGSARA
jgi:hypothetical protein